MVTQIFSTYDTGTAYAGGGGGGGGGAPDMGLG